MPFSIALQRLSRLSLTLAASLALAGCASLNPFGSGDKEGGTAQLPCPQVGVLGETDHMTLLRGAGADLTDIVARAEIGKVVSKCTYNVSDATITVDLAFDGVAELGPAATSRDLTFNAFVAVTRRFETLDKKQIYQIPVSFPAGQRQVRFLKTVDGTVLPYGGTADGRIYQILVGFQLTAEQLEYNRRVSYVPIR
ncbi:MAG: hypothetical protein WD671_04155 [Parvibaculum sp.]